MTSRKVRPSLVDFASTENVSKAQPCWLCNIPEREEVERAVLSGQVTRAAAIRWLNTHCGYGDRPAKDRATDNKLKGHFADHVRAS